MYMILLSGSDYNNNELFEPMGNLIQSDKRLELEKNYRITKEGHYDLTLLEELGTKN